MKAAPSWLKGTFGKRFWRRSPSDIETLQRAVISTTSRHRIFLEMHP